MYSTPKVIHQHQPGFATVVQIIQNHSPTAGAIPPTDAGPGTLPATAAACAAAAA
jgi:hypothetical protein